MNGTEQCLYSAFHAYWHNVLNGEMSREDVIQVFARIAEIRNESFRDYVGELKGKRNER